MRYCNFIIIYSSNFNKICQNHEVCELFCKQKFQKCSIFKAKPCKYNIESLSGSYCDQKVTLIIIL